MQSVQIKYEIQVAYDLKIFGNRIVGLELLIRITTETYVRFGITVRGLSGMRYLNENLSYLRVISPSLLKFNANTRRFRFQTAPELHSELQCNFSVVTELLGEQYNVRHSESGI